SQALMSHASFASPRFWQAPLPQLVVNRQSNMATISPTTRAERIQIIDVLRGLAIFGILMVNIHYFAQPWSAPPPTAGAPFIDRAANWLVQMFFTTKFFNLFSFLFGLGMALQMQRAEVKGVRFVPL